MVGARGGGGNYRAMVSPDYSPCCGQGWQIFPQRSQRIKAESSRHLQLALDRSRLEIHSARRFGYSE
jgi:hypothetical protein